MPEGILRFGIEAELRRKKHGWRWLAFKLCIADASDEEAEARPLEVDVFCREQALQFIELAGSELDEADDSAVDEMKVAAETLPRRIDLPDVLLVWCKCLDAFISVLPLFKQRVRFSLQNDVDMRFPAVVLPLKSGVKASDKPN